MLMTLRFEVDQAEACRQGVDVPKSTCHLDVDPSKLSQEERNLIADRLVGIDVTRFEANWDGIKKALPVSWDSTKGRIIAPLPTFEGLIKAIRENETKVQAELKQLQSEPEVQAELKRRNGH